MEITGRGCCLTILGILFAFIGGTQVYLLVSKLSGNYMSWWWTFTPIWGTILIVFGVPVLFSIANKLIKLIKYKRDDKA